MRVAEYDTASGFSPHRVFKIIECEWCGGFATKCRDMGIGEIKVSVADG